MLKNFDISVFLYAFLQHCWLDTWHVNSYAYSTTEGSRLGRPLQDVGVALP